MPLAQASQPQRLRQLFEQRYCLLQIGGVELLAEPAVYANQKASYDADATPAFDTSLGRYEA